MEVEGSSLDFGCRARCCGVCFFLGWAAVEAHKHGRAQDALERAVVARLVHTAFDTAHGVAGAAEAFKR